jgi:hypothetical protein
MALPGLVQNVLDGNLNLQQGSNAQTMLVVGPCLNGVPNTLTYFGDQATMTAALGGGKALELAAYILKVGGGQVGVMPTGRSITGGVSSPVKVGSTAGALSASALPHQSITIVTTTSGTLGGGAAFTFALGSGAPSAPVTSQASWSSTGYAIPGTFATLIFTAGSYVAGGTPDTYTVSALGTFAHPVGTGPAVPTGSASPVDDYTPTVTVVSGGALGTMQFTYSLDGTSTNTSAAILSSAGGQYAIPGTGIVLNFSGAPSTGDYWTFSTAGPTFNGSEKTAAQTALQTTYLAQAQYAMVAMVDGNASASAWATACGADETTALSLFANGVFVRFFESCPTVGTVIPNTGAVLIDSADTDAVVAAARQTISAPHVVPCAGDVQMSSPLTGLSLRRSALWPIVARASKVEASKNLGAVADGGLNSVTKLYRDENATPAFDAVGITSLRTYSGAGANGFYVTDAHTGALSTSDYYPLTNARVIDRACGIARTVGLPYVNAKIPTTTRGANVGVIAEGKAKQIDGAVSNALAASLVLGNPQDAVAVAATTNRFNNVLGTSQLIIAVAVQPFAYARTVTENIGMTISP